MASRYPWHGQLALHCISPMSTFVPSLGAASRCPRRGCCTFGRRCPRLGLEYERLSDAVNECAGPATGSPSGGFKVASKLLTQQGLSNSWRGWIRESGCCDMSITCSKTVSNPTTPKSGARLGELSCFSPPSFKSGCHFRTG